MVDPLTMSDKMRVFHHFKTLLSAHLYAESTKDRYMHMTSIDACVYTPRVTFSFLFSSNVIRINYLDIIFIQIIMELQYMHVVCSYPMSGIIYYTCRGDSDISLQGYRPHYFQACNYSMTRILKDPS